MVYIKYINSIYYIVKFIRLGTPKRNQRLVSNHKAFFVMVKSSVAQGKLYGVRRESRPLTALSWHGFAACIGGAS